MYRPFGPQYKTTGVDRNNRMLTRAQQGIQAGAGEVSGAGFMLPVAPPDHRTSMRQGAGLNLAASSMLEPVAQTSAFARNALSRPSLSDTHNSLMDIDNNILESFATVDAVTGSVEVRQRMHDPELINFSTEINQQRTFQNLPPPVHNRFESFETQYVPVEDFSRRETRNYNAVNPMCGENPRQISRLAGLPRVNCNVGQRGIVEVQESIQTQQSHTLSKTDRTVVMELIKGVRSVNGSNESELLSFLKELSPLFEISPNCSAEVIKLLLPKVSGTLFKLWLEAIAAHAEWHELHSEILNAFFPALRRREVEASELDRPQRANENFSEYCENVIAVAFALRTKLSETEVVEIILNKCAPATKGHFAFSNPPRTIVELRVLANKVSSSMMAETRYFGVTNNPAQFNVGRASRQNQSRFSAENYPQNRRTVSFENTERKIFVCYKCGQEGHIARHCRLHLNRK